MYNKKGNTYDKEYYEKNKKKINKRAKIKRKKEKAKICLNIYMRDYMRNYRNNKILELLKTKRKIIGNTDNICLTEIYGHGAI